MATSRSPFNRSICDIAALGSSALSAFTSLPIDCAAPLCDQNGCATATVPPSPRTTTRPLAPQLTVQPLGQRICNPANSAWVTHPTSATLCCVSARPPAAKHSSKPAITLGQRVNVMLYFLSQHVPQPKRARAAPVP